MPCLFITQPRFLNYHFTLFTFQFSISYTTMCVLDFKQSYDTITIDFTFNFQFNFFFSWESQSNW